MKTNFILSLTLDSNLLSGMFELLYDDESVYNPSLNDGAFKSEKIIDNKILNL